MALAKNLNVHNTCLNILKKGGYKLWLHSGDPDADVLESFWCAVKNGYEFLASNPIEFLGLTSIYEFKGEPTEEEKSYW